MKADKMALKMGVDFKYPVDYHSGSKGSGMLYGYQWAEKVLQHIDLAEKC
jgi:hypothetical protein